MPRARGLKGVDMAVFSSILCAVDASSLAPRVVRHAVGLAGVCGSDLTLLTVSSGETRPAEAAVAALARAAVPGGAAWMPQPRVRGVRVTVGTPADAILEIAREGCDLIVAGTHAKSGIARWLLGSTSATLLAQARCPVLLVPPGDLEIVAIEAGGPRLRPGTVLGPIDLDDPNDRQLRLAHNLAALGGAPLALMTVGQAGADAALEAAVRDRARTAGVTPDRVLAVSGASVAEAIDRTAIDLQAGLVVMGVRWAGHGPAGEIATAVLRTKDALVLTVPAV